MKTSLVVVVALMWLMACSAQETAAPTTPDKPEGATPATSDKKPEGDKADEAKAPPSAPASAAARQPEESTGHFGADFSMTDATPIAALIDDHKSHVGKTIKVTGTVSSVCKKKGCWMVMKGDKEGQQTVRVTMKDYGFFVPKDCDGKNAVVEGVFEIKEVKEEMRKHLAEDQGKDPAQVTGSDVELRIVATGITIKS